MMISTLGSFNKAIRFCLISAIFQLPWRRYCSGNWILNSRPFKSIISFLICSKLKTSRLIGPSYSTAILTVWAAWREKLNRVKSRVARSREQSRRDISVVPLLLELDRVLLSMT